MPTYCLTITIPSDQYELLISHFYDLGMLGCEEHSAADGVQVKVYFKDELSARQAAMTLHDRALQKNVEIEQVMDQDWNATWRAAMKPARLSRGYWVSPLWLPPPKSAKHWIKIEPKMAFGTGHHETTRLAAQAIIAQKRWIKNKRVLDIGTGSGVLCFVADLCGASSCLGAEIDPCCGENLAENYCQNAPSGKISFMVGSVDALRTCRAFDCVVMNMILTESTPLIETILKLLKPDGLLIWSGILADENSQTVDIAKNRGFSLVSGKTEHEWWCGVFRVTKS